MQSFVLVFTSNCLKNTYLGLQGFEESGARTVMKLQKASWALRPEIEIEGGQAMREKFCVTIFMIKLSRDSFEFL